MTRLSASESSRSPRRVESTRSQNTTVTILRSSRTVEAALSRAPHREQNLASRELGCLQASQTCMGGVYVRRGVHRVDPASPTRFSAGHGSLFRAIDAEERT